MIRKIYRFFLMSVFCGGMTLAASCSAEGDEVATQVKAGGLTITTSVVPFDDGVHSTRTNIEGNAFLVGDRIKLKVICPFNDDGHTQFVETTHGNSADGLWLLKWTGSNWAIITSDDGVDVAGTYQPSNSYNLFGQYEAQQTPYIYTASTWNENVRFVAGTTLYSQFSYIFQADQTDEDDYLKSDLLWAQSYMQTGSYNVHLSFNHVMACLKITIPNGFSEKAVLTLEGMPDIDQREVVVGDYYAAKSKINSKYGYKDKCSCSSGDNGKVLGVAVNDESAGIAVVKKLNGSDVTNNGVYTAHRHTDGNYYLIVPPCDLGSTKAKFWIRDGEKRYSYELQRTKFDQGKLYPVTIN